MYEGDMSRKRTLVEHGFRLPSAMDNRPLKFEEFVDRIGQTVYLSATPGPYELGRSRGEFVEQVIRPTGLVDPEVIVKPTKGQIDDLVSEIRERAQRDERILVTTLTKKMAEDLTDYLLELGVRVRYLHSEVDTLRRVELLRELRHRRVRRPGRASTCSGRGSTFRRYPWCPSWTPTRRASCAAARRSSRRSDARRATCPAQVHMYADTITPSMQRAIDETNRRRAKQISLQRRARTRSTATAQAHRRHHRHARPGGGRHRRDAGGSGRSQSRGKSPVPGRGGAVHLAVVCPGAVCRRAWSAWAPMPTASSISPQMPRAELADLIQQLNAQMLGAARELQFEVAARLRDEIAELKKELRGMDAAGVR